MYVHSLHLENIKAFQELDLEFKRPDATGGNLYAGLNIFLGGNASGKSTLLKSIAMALSGPTVANQQLITPTGWLRGESSKGSIELDVLWNVEKDLFQRMGRTPQPNSSFKVALLFEAADKSQTTRLKAKQYRTPTDTRIQTADRGPWRPDSKGWFLGAYGPLRRLTGSSTEAMRYALGKGRLATCVTLFREDAALSESESWLKQEHARSLEESTLQAHSASLVEGARAFLNDGLLPQGFEISKITVDRVFMTTPHGGELPLQDLSDGCRSAYALMLDIIHNMAVSYGSTDLFGRDSENRLVVNQPGVILIDELEAHLHPSWQRTICDWLKTRFPQIQFFITTHSPLIAQAADPGGIFVLPLPHEAKAGKSARRLSPQAQERITLGRAEKVLLGEAFGLKQTWSKRAEKLVHEWESLAALQEAQGTLGNQERGDYERLARQMTIIFEDTPEGAPHA